MRRVFTASDPTEAELVRGLLESAGIKAEVRGADMWGARGAIGPDTAPGIWIEDDEKAPEAETLLADFYKSRPTVESATWTCPKCAEAIAPQFTECWKCGTERPA